MRGRSSNALSYCGDVSDVSQRNGHCVAMSEDGQSSPIGLAQPEVSLVNVTAEPTSLSRSARKLFSFFARSFSSTSAYPVPPPTIIATKYEYHDDNDISPSATSLTRLTGHGSRIGARARNRTGSSARLHRDCLAPTHVFRVILGA